MDWKEMPNPYGGVRLSLPPFGCLDFIACASNCNNKIREKFWSFFGVFTEEARAIEPKQHPKNSGR